MELARTSTPAPSSWLSAYCTFGRRLPCLLLATGLLLLWTACPRAEAAEHGVDDAAADLEDAGGATGADGGDADVAAPDGAGAVPDGAGAVDGDFDIGGGDDGASLVLGARAWTSGGVGQALEAAVHILSPVRSTTPEELKAEIIAAEAALALRAEVDGAPAVYDSPAVSISLRRVSPGALTQSGAKLEAADGAGITIPADPRVKGRHGGPVTVTITSFHAGDRIKELPKVKYGANREYRTVGGPGAISGKKHEEDRVDFFMTKTSVAWRGTVNVKVPGLNAQVPAHDRPWTPYGSEEDAKFREEKAEVRREVEELAAMPDAVERSRGLRRLARRWHPDKNPGDEERATEVFAYLQELREALFPA